jgi:hypothetical protein
MIAASGAKETAAGVKKTAQPAARPKNFCWHGCRAHFCLLVSATVPHWLCAVPHCAGHSIHHYSASS